MRFSTGTPSIESNLVTIMAPIHQLLVVNHLRKDT